MTPTTTDLAIERLRKLRNLTARKLGTQLRYESQLKAKGRLVAYTKALELLGVRT